MSAVCEPLDMPSRPIMVTKCCVPGCNSYAMELDGNTPCEECRARGIRSPPAPLRPSTFNGRPGRVPSRAERVEVFREKVREAVPLAEAYARTAVDVFNGVQRVRRVLRKIPW
jgi:hypothetical protein